MIEEKKRNYFFSPKFIGMYLTYGIYIGFRSLATRELGNRVFSFPDCEAQKNKLKCG